jgi:hypothetical protein
MKALCSAIALSCLGGLGSGCVCVFSHLRNVVLFESLAWRTSFNNGSFMRRLCFAWVHADGIECFAVAGFSMKCPCWLRRPGLLSLRSGSKMSEDLLSMFCRVRQNAVVDLAMCPGVLHLGSVARETAQVE